VRERKRERERERERETLERLQEGASICDRFWKSGRTSKMEVDQDGMKKL
jgi:hypothetical protein